MSAHLPLALDPLSFARRERLFWAAMNYQCDGCGRVMVFFLEDGCEGPRNGEQVSFVVKRGPYAGKKRPWPKTASGRLVVPVPFVGAGCPTCQPTKPWSLERGTLRHTDWTGDAEFPDAMMRSPDVPPDCAMFWYPAGPVNVNNTDKCGVAVLPSERALFRRDV